MFGDAPVVACMWVDLRHHMWGGLAQSLPYVAVDEGLASRGPRKGAAKCMSAWQSKLANVGKPIVRCHGRMTRIRSPIAMPAAHPVTMSSAKCTLRATRDKPTDIVHKLSAINP